MVNKQKRNSFLKSVFHELWIYIVKEQRFAENILNFVITQIKRFKPLH